MTRITIVDEHDLVIGTKERSAVQGDIYRVAALWITNRQGDVLVAQRALSKSHDPGKWGPAVAGTVEAGETYEENILKESFEELGLRGLQLRVGPKVFVQGRHRFFVQWFLAEWNGTIADLSLDHAEVAAAKWVPLTVLRRDAMLAQSPYVPSMKDALDALDKRVRSNSRC